jgi:exoribonuclease R
VQIVRRKTRETQNKTKPHPDKMKTRTLFQTAIEYVMDAKNHSVHSKAMKKEYSNYLCFHKSGDTASWETARKAIWEMLIDSGALEKSFQNAKLAI